MTKKSILLLASGEASPDIRYLTGLSTPDEFIALNIDGRTYAILSPLEYQRGKLLSKADCQVWCDVDCDGPERMKIFAWLSRHFGITDFQVAADFPLLWADKLRDAGFRLTPQSRLLPEREFKTPDEVAKLAAAESAAQRGALRAMQVLAEATVRDSGEIVWQNETLTSEILRAEIDTELIRHGMLPTGTICAGGTQSAYPHHVGNGALRAGMPIVMDIFPRSIDSGYWGDLTRTVVKGQAPEIVRRAHTAVCEAKKRSIEQIRPGAIPAELHRNAESILLAHGFRTGHNDAGDFGFFHGLGHGVGLEIHESPRISPKNSAPLQGGEVFSVEPGLYYPEWGGIRQEDLVYLSPTGEVQNLATIPDTLEIP